MSIELFCQDVLEFLRSIESDSVDLVIADPPFNVDYPYVDYLDKRVDYQDWCRLWITECFRIVKPTGSIYLMTLVRHLSFKMQHMDTLGTMVNLIPWKNVASNSPTKAFWSSYQPILFYVKSDDYKFNPEAQRRLNTKSMGGLPSSWGKEPAGKMIDYWGDIPFVYCGSHTHPEAILKPGTNQKAHQAQMPEGLAGRCILFSTDEGDLVVDPFSGSGTTAATSSKLKRNFKGCDNSASAHEIATERINKLNHQLF